MHSHGDYAHIDAWNAGLYLTRRAYVHKEPLNLFWKLEGTLAVPCTREECFAHLEDPTRHHLFRTDLSHGAWISTIFLGINHNYTGTEPILFETMAFGDEMTAQVGNEPPYTYNEVLGEWRYPTYADAQEGHQRACELIQAQLQQMEQDTNERLKRLSSAKPDGTLDESGSPRQ